MTYSKMPTEAERSVKPSTKGRVATPAEHRMKRLHEKKVQTIAEEMAAALNAAMRGGKKVV